MISWTLGLLFPPKLGKIEDVDSVVLRHQLANGEFEIIDPGPPEAGVSKVRQWREGKWGVMVPDFPPANNTHGKRKEPSQETAGQLQPAHPRVGDGSCIPGSRLLWVRPS
jgi:hypothetical protein